MNVEDFAAKRVFDEEPPKDLFRFDFSSMRIPKSFTTARDKITFRDLNKNPRSPTFYLYSKDDINSYLQNPYSNESRLRNASIYIYGASSHYRRIIQYFASLSDLSYVIVPYNIDTTKANPSQLLKRYQNVSKIVGNLCTKDQLRKILVVCFREDVFYGTIRSEGDALSIQQLPSDNCAITTMEGNVANVTFDFSYFDTNSQYLEYYSTEFQTKYDLYQKDRSNMRWQELDSPNSFAVKCNSDTLEYAIPPFAGILREIYDIEDYKQLKLTKAGLENYAIVAMQLTMNSNGSWSMDFDKARDFWRNLDSVLPEEVGSVLTPMPLEKISFDRSGVADTNYIAEAESQLFGAAGVSSLLFNNEKASSNSLLLSIKTDQALTFSLVKSIEAVVNRFIQSQTYGKNFKVSFLDVSPYNRKEAGESYIKGCTYGIPMVSHYCASQGISQSDMDSLNYLEDQLLDIKSRFVPLKSSSTMSGDSVGAPQKEIGDLSDNGETARELESE